MVKSSELAVNKTGVDFILVEVGKSLQRPLPKGHGGQLICDRKTTDQMYKCRFLVTNL